MSAKIWPRYIDYKGITGLLASIFQEAYMLSPRYGEPPANGDQKEYENPQSQSRGTKTSKKAGAGKTILKHR